MKPGDLVWFDAFYHKNKKESQPKEYSVQAIVVKKYSLKEKYKTIGAANIHRFQDEDLYDIMTDGKIYVATSKTIIPVLEAKEAL
jgi:hypothetical protein